MRRRSDWSSPAPRRWGGGRGRLGRDLPPPLPLSVLPAAAVETVAVPAGTVAAAAAGCDGCCCCFSRPSLCAWVPPGGCVCVCVCVCRRMEVGCFGGGEERGWRGVERGVTGLRARRFCCVGRMYGAGGMAFVSCRVSLPLVSHASCQCRHRRSHGVYDPAVRDGHVAWNRAAGLAYGTHSHPALRRPPCRRVQPGPPPFQTSRHAVHASAIHAPSPSSSRCRLW